MNNPLMNNLNDYCNDYLKFKFPDGCTEEEKRKVRQAFFMGSMAVFTAIGDSVRKVPDGEKIDTEKAMDYFDSLRKTAIAEIALTIFHDVSASKE